MFNNGEMGAPAHVKNLAPSCTFLGKRASFLHYWSCKPRIVHISCTGYVVISKSCISGTCYFARWKCCKFFAPDILQDETLQVACKWLCKWKSGKFLIQTFALKFLQDTTSYTCVYTILEFLLLCKVSHLATLAFWISTGFHKYPHTVLVNVDFVNGIHL